MYLDTAATSPVRREALEAAWPFLTGEFGNPSSHHRLGERAAEALDDARARVARVLGMRAGDVSFTSSGTEADNLAVIGIALASTRGRHLVTSPIEHEAVLESADYLRRHHGFEVTLVEVLPDGTVTPQALRAAVRSDTAVVSLSYANNEIGTVADVGGLATVARERGIPFHTDAVQAAAWLPLADLGADAVTLAGHKVGAPKGIGVAGIRGRVPVEPLIHGGGQERGRRSGTENVAFAVALATALELAESERTDAAARAARVRDAFIARVLADAPGAFLTGSSTSRLPNHASFCFRQTSGEAVLLELERRGVTASSGSACAAGSDEPSHVLTALGIEPDLAQTSVRFTFPATAEPQHAEAAAAAVTASVASLASTFH
ncbi:cysteine desulfurase family protein [Paramicrobacterium agarici]|uniref:cysteine desulfurase family protein n=1 Tax=Paramicrobacterium agarici TaxID=630514 RepID=UPI0011507859|nr:cysteine desulfurase family protein [Microbacterium agarici]TQO21604.1 cysteine desulfurase [Microbacterium agarici]